MIARRASFLGAMKKQLTSFLCGLCGAGALWAGADTAPLYQNFGSLTNTPQIDAEAFANYGAFWVFSPGDAYDFMNTRYYTNFGVMSSVPGFLFDTVDDFGARTNAEVFYNAAGASVDAGGALSFQSSGTNVTAVSFQPAALRIHAKKIINRGLLNVEHDGLVELVGEDVDLSRGALGVQPIIFGSGYQIMIGDPADWGYWPDEGVMDVAWGLGVQDPHFASSGLITSFMGSLNAMAPTHCTTNSMFTDCIPTSFFLADPASFVYTNRVDPTNWIIQVVLVALEDTNTHAQVNFYPSSQPTNYFNTVTLQLATVATNQINGADDLISIYLIDRLASETNFTVLTNFVTQGMPFRASPYELTRNPPAEFMMGFPTNAVFRSNLAELIYNPGGASSTW